MRCIYSKEGVNEIIIYSKEGVNEICILPDIMCNIPVGVLGEWPYYLHTITGDHSQFILKDNNTVCI